MPFIQCESLIGNPKATVIAISFDKFAVPEHPPAAAPGSDSPPCQGSWPPPPDRVRPGGAGAAEFSPPGMPMPRPKHTNGSSNLRQPAQVSVLGTRLASSLSAMDGRPLEAPGLPADVLFFSIFRRRDARLCLGRRAVCTR